MKAQDVSVLLTITIFTGLAGLISGSQQQQIYDDQGSRNEAQDYLDAFYSTSPDNSSSESPTSTIEWTTSDSTEPAIVSHLAIETQVLTENLTNSSSLENNQASPTNSSLEDDIRAGSTGSWATFPNPLKIGVARAAVDDNGTVEARNAGASSTTELTPYSDMVGFSRLEVNMNKGFYGNSCTVYGDTIEIGQQTDDAFVGDGMSNATRFTQKVNDDFQVKVCKLSHRLECVRDRYLPVTTEFPDEEQELAPGTCRCLRALSDRAIFLTSDANNKKLRRGCYIPAGFQQSSRCGHIVPLPYGIIKTVGRNTRFPLKEIPVTQRHVGNTSLMCVPNAECRTSSRYISRRCQCKKDAIWHYENGTCEKMVTRLELFSGSCKQLHKISIIVILSCSYNIIGNIA